MLCTHLSKSVGRKSPLPANINGINTTETGVERTANSTKSLIAKL